MTTRSNEFDDPTATRSAYTVRRFGPAVGGAQAEGEEVGTVATSVRTIRWLAWALAIFAIVNAVITLGFALNIGAPPPPAEGTDLVERLIAVRADDSRIFGVVVVQSLAAIGVFLVAALL